MTAKKKRKKKGSVLTSIGILLLLAALGLTGYNLWDGLRAGQESRAIEEKIAAQMPETIVEAHEPQAMEEIDLTMPVFEIDGYKYVGGDRDPFPEDLPPRHGQLGRKQT